ncbi:MAG: O-antigen ligase family protein [Chloroflexi bacterium]|nr:O-antigen ligase family protein [Chloroflexota bacterium]
MTLLARPPLAARASAWWRAARVELADWFLPPWERGLLSPRATVLVGIVLVGLALVIATQPLRVLVAGLAAAVFFVLSLVRPVVGLGLILFSVPFGTLAPVDVRGITLTATEPLIGLVTLAWLLRVAAARQLDWRWSPLVVPLVLFLLLEAQSVAVAPAFTLAAKEYAKWLEALALLVVTAQVVRRQEQVVFLVACLLGAGTLAALQGWYQFFFRQGPEGFLIAERFIRAYGEFGQPNPYAGFLNLSLPFALAVLLVALLRPPAARGRAPQALLLAVAGVAGVIAAAEAMTFSRAAWLGLAVAVVAMLAVCSRRTLGLLLGGLTVGLVIWLLGALDLLPAVALERLRPLAESVSLFDVSAVELTPENWSVVERVVTWQTALEMAATNPWYGIGPGSFQVRWPEFAPLEWVLRGSNPPHAHNFYLNQLAESGIIGLAAYLILIGAAFAYTTVRVRAAQRLGRWQGHLLAHPFALALGLLGVLLALSVHNVFDALFVHGMTAQLGLTLGLVEASWQARAQHAEGA